MLTQKDIISWDRHCELAQSSCYRLLSCILMTDKERDSHLRPSYGHLSQRLPKGTIGDRPNYRKGSPTDPRE